MHGLEKETFLRVLRGAPLTVLMAIWLRGGMCQNDIQRATGYGERATKRALEFLEDLELVHRPHYRKWQLSTGFQQLPLARFREDDETRKMQVSERETRNAQVSALVSSSSNLLTTIDDSETLQNLLESPDETILAACKKHKIFGKKQRLLASLPHVVEAGPDYIAYHVQQTKREGQRIGAAIWRMEQGWAMPDDEPEVDELAQQIPEHLRGIVKR